MATAQNKIEITANGHTLTATAASTEAAARFVSLLADGPVTIGMNDYGGFEKVGDLPWALPASDRQTTAAPGDIMLYLGRSIVIFYGSNSWAYTPLGHIDGVSATDLRSILAGGRADVTFSLPGHSGIDGVTADGEREPEVFTPDGRRIALGGKPLDSLPAGLYIVNGKKQLISR